MKQVKISADLIPQDEGGYTVYCPELDIYTEGETEQECLANLKEAALLHLEEMGSENLKIREVKHRVVELAIGV